METKRRPLWQYMSIARTPIPTKGLLVVTGVLIALLIFATITQSNGPRPLPAPIGTAAAEPLGNGQFVFYARSAGVRQGVPYRFKMLTHCGLGYAAAVDFDGSFWEPVDPGLEAPNPPQGFGNPTDQGVIILRSATQADYQSSHGVVVSFRRRSGSVTAVPCA